MTLENLTRATSERGSFLPLRVFAVNAGSPGTGLSVTVGVSRESDGLLYDWDDGTFKETPTTEYEDMEESSSVLGLYELTLDHSSLVVPDRLLATVFVDGAMVVFAVDVVDRTDPVPDLAVSYSAADEKFTFVATLANRDGLADSGDAEPTLSVYGSDGTLVFTADPEDFSESNGVFSYEYSGVLIVAGAWVAALSFEAFGAQYVAEFAFNVGE